MFTIIHAFSCLAFIIFAAIWFKSFLTNHRKSALGCGVAAMLSLFCMVSYYLPFHIRLDPDEIVLISFEERSDLVVDVSLDPEGFDRLNTQVQALDFRRPVSSDLRIDDASQNDSICLSNQDRNIYMILPSDSDNGYAVLNREAIAPLTDSLLQTVLSF